jgi:hypothetical protein
MNKIFVTVRGGRPYIIEETVPSGYTVELIDFDNIEEGTPWPSGEARNYCERVLGYNNE